MRIPMLNRILTTVFMNNIVRFFRLLMSQFVWKMEVNLYDFEAMVAYIAKALGLDWMLVCC